jgi:hypothetical protein
MAYGKVTTDWIYVSMLTIVQPVEYYRQGRALTVVNCWWGFVPRTYR